MTTATSWARRRWGLDTIRRPASGRSAAIASTSASPSVAYSNNLQQQQALARSVEKMFEEAELSGILTLVGRKLKDFPSTVASKFDLMDLVSADLAENRLNELPTCVCGWRSLETLRISSNVMLSLPTAVTHLEALTFLDLSFNKLTFLPAALFELNLEILLVAGNRLESIPREIRQLAHSLEELDVSGNELRSLPADLALLKSLKVLNLRKNFVEQFPSELCRLQLYSLDLSQNSFTHLPLHMRKMCTLCELHWQGNPLVQPPLKVMEMGRAHIFKWMEVEASGRPHLDHFHTSASTLRPVNTTGGTLTGLTRNATIGGHDDEVCVASPRKSSASASLCTSARSRRVMGGTDSGYASTADEHRLSHELNGGMALDEISEGRGSPSPPLCPPPVPPHTSPPSIARNPLLAKPADRSSLYKLMDVYDKEMDSIRSPVAPTIVDNLDVSNNNTVSSTETTQMKTNNTTTTVRRQPIRVPMHIGENGPSSKPISKVSPIVNGSSARPTVAAAAKKEPVSMSKNNIDAKPAAKAAPLRRSAPTPTTPTVTSLKSSSNSSSALTKSMTTSIRSAAAPTKVPAASTVTRKPINGSMASLNGAKPRVARTNGVQAKSTEEVKPVPAKSTSSVIRPAAKAPTISRSQSAELANIDSARKILEERLAISLNADTFADQLADGVHLCNFANTIRLRSVSTVLTTVDDTALTPPKCRRNVDNFVAACRRLGVPEAAITSVSDVLGAKNVQHTSKTILALARLAPPATTKKEATNPVSESLVEKRITHV